MRNLLLGVFFSSSLIITSCGPSYKMIGEVNMISNRNIDVKNNYVLLSSYAGGTKKEIKKSKAKTIDEALNNTVAKTPGGEYIMNVKIYKVGGIYYAVVGDVFGLPTEANYHGFKVGDKVLIRKNNTKGKKGVIISFKDLNQCVVQLENDKYLDVLYSDIVKIDN